MTERFEALRLLENEIGILIRRIRPVLSTRASLVHPELQTASYLMLSWLAKQGPVRPASIVEAFGIDKGAVSRQLNHLVDLGLVDRSSDPEDGRASVVSASKVALQRLGSVARQRRALLDSRLQDWSDAEITDLVASLSRYNTAIEA